VSRKLFVGGKAKKCSSSVLIFIPALDQAIYALKENQPGASASQPKLVQDLVNLALPHLRVLWIFS